MNEPVARIFPVLPTRGNMRAKSPVGRFMTEGGRSDRHEKHATKPWYLVLWLTGVDYFSTLGYQPGIALLFAGALSPIATGLLVLVTLFGALPIYSQVAARSYAGQGSIAMLETLLEGWWAKVLVLTLLGFAATDFVITMTLSSADAVQHAMENPFLHEILTESWRVPLTIALLALLAGVFVKGFNEAIGLATLVAVPYILFNLVVLGRAMIEVFTHPSALEHWRLEVNALGSPGHIAIAALIVFPKLALGLSGFETGVSVMPLVSGEGDSNNVRDVPHGRIRATRNLLFAAAAIMSVLLLISSFVTTCLIPEEAYRKGGDAYGRAIAFLAHKYLGHGIGTAYDISTIIILWFAGASAMAGLLNVIPRYLPRFGMAPAWVSFRRPLVLILFAVCVVVTLAFHADVEAQSGAYATGVLVLMLSAAIAVSLALWREHRWLLSVVFGLIGGVFAFTLVDNVIGRPDGLIIASLFILAVMVLGAISRYLRSTELRVSELAFNDTRSVELWHSIINKKVNFVPLRTKSPEARRKKAAEIRTHYNVTGKIAFINVELLDNRSEFVSALNVHIETEGDDLVISITGAIAIANTIAYISELTDPIRIFLGLTRENPVVQSIRYLLWGEGETGFMVHKILVEYWAWTPEDDVRPLIFLMSE